jgi:hypothetical protein
MSKNTTDCKYQYVWVDSINWKILTRGVKWYDTLDICRKFAKQCPNPPINESCYLLIESSCPCYIDIATSVEIIHKMTKPCACFTTCNDECLDIDGFMCLNIGSKMILRAPWFTSSSKHCPTTYSFKIKGDVDEWFHSEEYDIFKAYTLYLAR